MDAVVKWYSVGGQVGDRLPRLEPQGWGLSAEPVIPKNQGRARAAGLVHTLKELLDFEVAAAFEDVGGMDSANGPWGVAQRVVEALVVQRQAVVEGSGQSFFKVRNARHAVVAKERVLHKWVVGQGVLAEYVAKLAQVVNGVLGTLGARGKAGVPCSFVNSLRFEVAVGYPLPSPRLPWAVPEGVLRFSCFGLAKGLSGCVGNEQGEDAARKQGEKSFKPAVVEQAVGSGAVAEKLVSLFFGLLQRVHFGLHSSQLRWFEVVELEVLVAAQEKIQGVVSAGGN